MKNIRLKISLSVLCSAILVLLLYTILHETGHMIVMLSAGEKITEFVIVGDAHVRGTGGDYTDFSDLWMHANGAVLPTVAAVIYALCYRKNVQNIFYRIFSFIAVLFPMLSAMVWVILPVFYLPGSKQLDPDVWNFLGNFTHDHSPLLVSAAALVIVTLMLVIVIRKGIPKNFAETVKLVKQ